jgi:HEPN domain-containing protein
MIEQARWWLNTARNDLKTAKLLCENGDYANSAFHSQQAAEKLLKAYIVSRGFIPRTHSCIELVDLIKDRFSLQIPEELRTDARKLDLQYIQSRYPNGLGGDPSVYYDKQIALETFECARKIFERFEKEIH